MVSGLRFRGSPAKAMRKISPSSAKIPEIAGFLEDFFVETYLHLPESSVDRSRIWCFLFAPPRDYFLSARAVIHCESQERTMRPKPIVTPAAGETDDRQVAIRARDHLAGVLSRPPAVIAAL
jgi:hypothetical protein